MMTEFDRRTFVDNLRATKPPYECPFQKCGRVYKSFSGIEAHIMNFKHSSVSSKNAKNTGGGNKGGLSVTSAVISRENNPLSLNSQSPKIIEYENSDGKLVKINILEPIEVVNVTPTDAKSDKQSALREIIQNMREKSASTSPKPAIRYPEPAYRILDEFESRDAPPMPAAYIKYIEKPPEELEDEIEYDMDEEDHAWLTVMNEMRAESSLPKVSEFMLEKVMDFFEKQCHFAASHQQAPLFDEDAVCCVCQDGECDNANAILFCDMCNLSVHQECYGVPYIPEGQWLCRRCQLSPSQAVDCVLCPNRGGAYKQTSDGRWAHVVCALWVPEVQFANTVFLEPIEGFERIPPARWKLSCYVCKQKRTAGACIQCHKPSCYTAFHVTCAQSAGLYMKIEPIKDLSPGGQNYTVRKTAYCDQHAPTDDCLDLESPEDSKIKNEKREESRAKIKKARKLLSQRRNSSPVVSIPVISKSDLHEIAHDLKFAGKQQFLDKLLKYWILKRQSRFGVPLLRRLQVTQPKKPVLPQTTKIDQLGQTSYWKQIRRDLEKARLLVELIRKREQRKKELIINSDNLLHVYLKPIFDLMTETVDRMLIKDEMNVFTKPVNEDEVPGYHRFVQHPMDLGTMLVKAREGKYLDPGDLQKDFDLMISNCLKFNKKTPFFLKYAQKMKKLCQPDFKECREEFEKILDQIASDFVPINSLKTNFEDVSSSSGPPSVSNREKAMTSSPASLFAKDKSELGGDDDDDESSLEEIVERSTARPTTKIRSRDGSGFTAIKKKRPQKSVGQTTDNKQTDIRNYFNDKSESKNVDLSSQEEDESGPLVRLAKNRRQKTTVAKQPQDSQQKSALTIKPSVSNTRKRLTALKTTRDCDEKDRNIDQSATTTPASVDFSPELSVSPSESCTITTTTVTATTATDLVQTSSGGPVKTVNSQSTSVNASGRSVKEKDSFRRFRTATSPLSPGAGSDADLEQLNVKYVNSESDDDSGPDAKDSAECAKDSAPSKDKEQKRKNSTAEKSPQKRPQQNPAENHRPSIVDLLEHLDIVWALTNDYAYYFPAVIIDHNNTTTYPSCIPKPPKDISKKIDPNQISSRYLILLFDKKSTWRWIEKHLVEPMFIDNDIDRRKLASPCKRQHQKILLRAYKTAVDFRCKNTGEEPIDFSLLTDTTISEDTDDSSC